MVATNWRWFDGENLSIPSIERMKEQVHELFSSLTGSPDVLGCGSGGFFLYRREYGLTLSFEVASRQVNFEEMENE